MEQLRPGHPCRRFDVFNDDWERVAVGTKLPSGLFVVEWLRESFPKEEQTNNPVISQYQSKADARQATGGEIIFEDPR